MTPPSPSIAGLIAELRWQTEVLLDMAHRGECRSFNGKLLRRAADALEKLATDLADRESKLEAANLMWNEGSLREGNLLVENDRLSTDLAAAKGALEPFADLADAYSDTFSDNLKLSIDESNNGDSTYAFTLGDLRRAYEILQPKVETP